MAADELGRALVAEGFDKRGGVAEVGHDDGAQQRFRLLRQGGIPPWVEHLGELRTHRL